MAALIVQPGGVVLDQNSIRPVAPVGNASILEPAVYVPLPARSESTNVAPAVAHNGTRLLVADISSSFNANAAVVAASSAVMSAVAVNSADACAADILPSTTEVACCMLSASARANSNPPGVVPS